MKAYFRFILTTLLFMGCVAYVIVSTNYQEFSGWTKEDKEDWIESCLGIGIGDKELCDCVLRKLELRYTSIEEMYKDPQEMAASMRSISAECKK